MRTIFDNAVLAGYAAQLNTTGAVVTTGASVDTRGYNTAALRTFVSQIGSGLGFNQGGSLAVVLQESSDNATFTTALDNTGTPIGVTVVATTTAVLSDARIEGLGLSNRKRYLRIQTTANFGGVASSLRQFTSCAVLELGRAYNRPVTSNVSNT